MHSTAQRSIAKVHLDTRCVCVIGLPSLLSAELPSLVINVSEMPFDNESAVSVFPPIQKYQLHITVAGVPQIDTQLPLNN